jgi:O-Antigen ligase
VRDTDRLGAWLTTLAIAALLSATAFYSGGGGALGKVTTTEIVLLLGGALVVAAAVLVAPRGTRAHGALPVALLAALAALSALSIGWAVNPSDAWLVANRLFAYLAVFAAVVALARVAPQRWPSVIGGIVLASAIVCAYALATKALPEWLNEFELFARLREPFGYWNAVGLSGALAVPGCLWLGARREGPPALNALAFPALGLCLAATLMAYSRGSLLAAAIGLAVWFALVPLRLRGATVLLVGGAGAAMIAVWSFGQDALSTDRSPLTDRAGAGGELLVLVLAVLALLYVAGLAAGFAADVKPLRATNRRRAGIALLVGVALIPVAAAGALATTDEGLRGSIDSAWSSLTDTSAVGPANDPSRLTATGSVRSRYWDEAFEMWSGEKATGIGAGGYATARPRYRQDLLDVRHAHGYVPETMAELGLLGMLVSLALLAAWLLAARTSILGARGPAGSRTAGPEFAGLVTLAAIAVTFGAHSMIDWTWAVPGVALVGLVAAAWVAGRGPGPAQPAAWRRPGREPLRIAAAVAIVIVALAACWSVLQPKLAGDAADDALAAMRTGDLERARELTETAERRNPLSIEPLLDRAAVEARAGRKEQAEAALEEAVRLQPANWLPWMRLTDYRLFELKEPRRAMESVRVAIFLNPRSWDVAQRYLDVRRRLKAK